MKTMLLGGQNSPNNCIYCDYHIAYFQHSSPRGRPDRRGTTRGQKGKQQGSWHPRGSPLEGRQSLTHLCAHRSSGASNSIIQQTWAQHWKSTTVQSKSNNGKKKSPPQQDRTARAADGGHFGPPCPIPSVAATQSVDRLQLTLLMLGTLPGWS